MNIDPDAARMLQFKKERMEEQKRMQELRNIELEMTPLIQEIQFTKARITEIKALLKRLDTESGRTKHEFDIQKKEEEAAKNNVELGQKSLSEMSTSTASTLKTLKSEIQKEKEIIKEHQVKLISLEKRENDIKNGGDKKGREEKSVLSRLLNILEREKRETQNSKLVLDGYLTRRDNARLELARLNTELEKLNIKLMALKRKI